MERSAQPIGSYFAELPARADVVIIGAGIAGLATAFHLVVGRGIRDVLVLERETQVAVHASGRNASIFRLLVPERLGIVLAQETQSELLRLPWGRKAIGTTGAVTIVTSAERERIARLVRVARSVDVRMVEWGPTDVEARTPLVDRPRVGAAFYTPDEGVIDIHALTQSLMREGTAAGVRVRLGCAVESIRTKGGRVAAVVTNAGTVEARTVVNAAGAWAGPLGLSCGGAHLPLSPRRRHLAFLRFREPTSVTWPVVWDLSFPLYHRVESGGLLLSLCEEEDVPLGNGDADPTYRDHLAYTLSSTGYPLSEARFVRAWTCHRTLTPDGNFMVGPDPQVGGLFWVAGLGGHGMSAGFAAGRIAAAFIAGQRPPEAAEIEPARFF